MKGYWITFTDGSSGYCEGQNDYDVITIAEKLTGKKIFLEMGKGLQQLPYPANPIIWQFDHPVYGKCPAFCYTPNVCKGNNSCPNRVRSCCE